MPHIILVSVFELILLPGLAMVFIPLFPAFWYLIAVALIFGIVDGFIHLTIYNFSILAGLFLASVVVDWSAGLLGAKFGGASWKSLFYGAIGGGIGFLLFPPFGAFAGLFTGVLIGELIRAREARAAFRAASGALIGSLTGIAINACLALVFVVFFFALALV